ncbi:tRNA (adenosine(37)-N6)-threonylcarbamoyltransferase complex transferase subunit TsaD [bacterium]|nr:tRNA (adenosine(37)-N6)-threonylcarbamoyltransferase complex transferase subunit TsaD [bacterium]
MKILAIDTSCDESCAAIIDTQKWKLLADVVHSHINSMKNFGGVVPEIASREHLKGLPLAVHEALDSAKLKVDSIDHFVVTNRPGLIGSLLVGLSFTKSLAFSLGKPFSTLNHIEAHLFSPLMATLDGKEPPPFPWIACVVSGGHTEIFHVESIFKYRWLGGTLDDAAGEAFDKVGKLLKLPYPAGPKIDRWVREAASEEHRTRFSFPRAKTEVHTLSFSGLKTAVALEVKKRDLSNADEILALAASAQEAILDALVEKLRQTQKLVGVQTLVLTGGVACNSRLREKLPEAHFPSPKHCTDNAAMVALLAGYYAKHNKLAPESWNTTAYPSLSTLEGK